MPVILQMGLQEEEVIYVSQEVEGTACFALPCAPSTVPSLLFHISLV